MPTFRQAVPIYKANQIIAKNGNIRTTLVLIYMVAKSLNKSCQFWQLKIGRSPCICVCMYTQRYLKDGHSKRLPLKRVFSCLIHGSLCQTHSTSCHLWYTKWSQEDQSLYKYAEHGLLGRHSCLVNARRCIIYRISSKIVESASAKLYRKCIRSFR